MEKDSDNASARHDRNRRLFHLVLVLFCVGLFVVVKLAQSEYILGIAAELIETGLDRPIYLKVLASICAVGIYVVVAYPLAKFVLHRLGKIRGRENRGHNP
jgi:hypothetical protein